MARRSVNSPGTAPGPGRSMRRDELGDSTVGITLSIYSHVSGEVHRSAAEEVRRRCSAVWAWRAVTAASVRRSLSLQKPTQ